MLSGYLINTDMSIQKIADEFRFFTAAYFSVMIRYTAEMTFGGYKDSY